MYVFNLRNTTVFPLFRLYPLNCILTCPSSRIYDFVFFRGADSYVVSSVFLTTPSFAVIMHHG